MSIQFPVPDSGRATRTSETVRPGPATARRATRRLGRAGLPPLPSLVPGREAIAQLRRLTPLLTLALGAFILSRLVPLSTFGAALSLVEAIAPALWGLALGATALSFVAIGRAEAVAHELTETGVVARAARRAGWRAVALAQGVGFGPLTAGLARARTLPGLGPWTLARLTATATLGFVVCLAVLVAGTVVASTAAGAGGLLAFAAIALVLARRLGPLPVVPGLSAGTALRLLLWTACDTAAAALVLWLFLPAAIPPGALYSAYLLALGAGLLSQSPGGLGAFELTLLTLLPTVPQSEVLAAILAYRIVYQVLPAMAAGALLLRTPSRVPAPPLVAASGQGRMRALHRSGQAEWGLAHQGAEVLLTPDQEQGWLTRRTAVSLAAIALPLGLPALRPLRMAARARGLSPLLYKCDARTAAAARRLGWRVLALAQEGTIAPAQWCADGPEKRQLRRKLKDATRAGVVIEEAAGGSLPLAEMTLVSSLWAARHGGERGFSMGRMAGDLVRRQVVMIARVDGRIVGFVTFHRARDEWALDLVRYLPEAPSGTTQALIVAAIARARAARVAPLSLAACPVPRARMPRRWRGDSLRQFKQSFAPRWVTRYACAPGWPSLVLGLASVAVAVRWPAPLADAPRAAGSAPLDRRGVAVPGAQGPGGPS